ncbi:DEAD/DEAH box helicase family protein [Flavobacteriales bacterium]|nr:DEAD/DEAH box helicase family protein [Flavobacteriales bacterium]
MPLADPLLREQLEANKGKNLYGYQEAAINNLMGRMEKFPNRYNLLFQLPTGGGKTVIFSELAKRFILETGKRVLILTHRIELCGQTSRMLNDIGIPNKIINSKVKELEEEDDHWCFVAMVETLNNRLSDERIGFENLGLVIIDEAHYNSFRKLFGYFSEQVILGVTATPLSSNIKLPLKDNYNELIVGESISSLVSQQFLSKATTYSYDVNLRSLKIGINGDYTVSSSERLYGNYLMQEKLLYAYEEKAKGTKTLIFNNGINTSKQVQAMFEEEGYDCMHLDNTHSEKEREEILAWFEKKEDAILSSVSILTTGFDSPSVQTIILNRATKSLTLYHQMIGRGSRVLPKKKAFNVIDLGNNARRFGLWEAHINWTEIFKSPNSFIEGLYTDEEIEDEFVFEYSDEMMEKLQGGPDPDFNMAETYVAVTRDGGRPKEAIEKSIQHHVEIIQYVSEDFWDAMTLAKELEGDIAYRIRLYSKCIAKTTENYKNWLKEEYSRKLQSALRTAFVTSEEEG